MPAFGPLTSSWSLVALAKLDERHLKTTREETFEQIRLALHNVPISMHDIRVGPPLFTNATRGYDISTYARGKRTDSSDGVGCEIVLSARFNTTEDFQ